MNMPSENYYFNVAYIFLIFKIFFLIRNIWHEYVKCIWEQNLKTPTQIYEIDITSK